MKISLITTPTRTYLPNTVLPFGVMYLASYLRDKGHEVQIVDVARTRQSSESIVGEIEQFGPSLIGISGIITSYLFTKILTGDIKKAFPGIPVVIGGHITIGNSSTLLDDVGCDYVITGYGEKAMLYLAEHLGAQRAIEDISGLSYKKNGNVISNLGRLFFKNIDEIPFPAYDMVDMEHYLTAAKNNPKLELYLERSGKKINSTRNCMVIGARGCTDHCSFCVHEFEHGGFYVHSIGYIINNIRLLYQKYGVRMFVIGEDLFLHNPGQAAVFADAMRKNFPDAYFSCSIRADYVTPGLLDALKSSNCSYLVYGFESGNDSILRVLGKRMDRSTNIRAYKLINGSGITPGCSFMVGTPGETRATLQDTIDSIKEGGMRDSAVFYTTPYPGSRLFKWCVENGLIGDIEAYLRRISNRDAAVLSINLTDYPDFVVRMMKVMVLNALENNKRAQDRKYRVPIRRLVFKRFIIPLLFELYFILYTVSPPLFGKGKKITALDLNSKIPLKLKNEMNKCA